MPPISVLRTGRRHRPQPGAGRALPTPSPPGEPVATVTQTIRLLSYNVQGGIYSRRFSDYFTNSWKHVLPHRERLVNLTRNAQLIQQFDVVGVQEVDAGSLRSAQVDEVRYLARQAGFPHWYSQVNRDLGPFAQHSNGFLSRLRPATVTEHRLPGLPGRGAVVAEIPLREGPHLAIGILHLALGWRARRRQLDYLAELSAAHPLLVLMGDFNCGSGSRSLRAMVRHTGMQGLDRRLKTFPSWRPRLSLDHILVSAPLRILAAQVLDYPLSDHLPISMTLALPEGLEFAEPDALRTPPFNPGRRNDATANRTRR